MKLTPRQRRGHSYVRQNEDEIVYARAYYAEHADSRAEARDLLREAAANTAKLQAAMPKEPEE